MPAVTYFKPAGVPLRFLEENRLTIDEAEATRLRDIEHLQQETCAVKMNISRPTFQRVLASARRKIAESLFTGKALRIEGGFYEFDISEIAPTPEKPLESPGRLGRKIEKTRLSIVSGGINNHMKIAIITDDGTTISQHYGRARQYLVMNIEEGMIISRETRPKAGHQDFTSGKEGANSCSHEVHGHGAGAGEKHQAMARNISDCSVLLAGGMGWGAYESLKNNNIEPIITDEKDIEKAVTLFLEGRLPNLQSRLH